MFKIIFAAALAAGVSAAADAQASHPQYSPDGNRLAYYVYDLDEGRGDLMLLDLAEGETRHVETGLVWSVSPSWAPGGNAFIFTGGPGGMADVWDIYRTDLTSGETEKLTDTAEREMHAHISPDGSQIAYIRMAPDPAVWLLDIETGAERRLTQSAGGEFHTKWSLSGDALLFDRHPDGRSEIIQLNLQDGSEIIRAESRSVSERVSLPSAYGAGGFMFARNSDDGSALVIFTGTEWLDYEAPVGWSVVGSAWRPGASEIAVELDQGRERSRIIAYDTATGVERILVE